MKQICLLLLLAALTAFAPLYAQKKGNKKKINKKEEKSNIQVAILLDTSNSMDGLIEQTKSQLWKMVNELALAKDANGNIPNFELALYEYGNDNLSKGEGFIRMVSALTTDLDLISEKLFELKTNGGSEYCGQVIQKATQELTWSKSNDDLKIVFIAGNEPFTQGPIDYDKSCKKAIGSGIIINTIFCGDEQEGIDGKWKSGALLADGKYLTINQNEAIVHIEAPQDEEIAKLNQQLNKTYIGYGAEGQHRIQLQTKQDANASSYGRANTVQRAISKSSKAYKNSSWDLVDAMKDKEVALEEIEEEALPEEMQEMDLETRKKYVSEKTKERQEIQEKINTLSKERRKYVANEREKMAGKNSKNLDAAIINTIREQANKNNFCIEEK